MAQSGKVKIPVQIGSESHPSGSRTGLVSTNGFGKNKPKALFSTKGARKRRQERNQEVVGGGGGGRECEKVENCGFPFGEESRRRKENGGPINVME